MGKKSVKNDYILMVASVLLLILSAGAVFWFSDREQDNNISQSAQKIVGRAALTIDFGDGEKRVFEGEIIENENLLNILNQSAKAGNLAYRLDKANNVSAIENFVAGKTKTWQWRVNDKKIEKSPYEIIIKPNDEILIKYE